MVFSFRSELTEPVRDYASNTPPPGSGCVDCSLGINPFGFAPELSEALKEYDFGGINRYPHADVLHRAVMQYWSGLAALEPGNISLCNGSFLGLFCLNDVIAGGARRDLVSFVPSFTDMLTSAAFFGMRNVKILSASEGGHVFDAAALASEVGADTAMVYLDRPNNPTGFVLPLDGVRRVLDAAKAAGCYVLVDEAYADYIPREESCISLFDGYDNLIVARTFSKGFGLANFRAAYLVSPPEIRALLDKILNPYILSDFVRSICAQALRYPQFPLSFTDYFASAKRAVRAETGNRLRMMDTDDRIPILALRDTCGGNLQQAFLSQGILTVSGAEFEGLDQSSVRISIPSEQNLPALLSAVRAINESRED